MGSSRKVDECAEPSGIKGSLPVEKGARAHKTLLQYEKVWCIQGQWHCLIGLEPRVQEDGEVGDEAGEINHGQIMGGLNTILLFSQ